VDGGVGRLARPGAELAPAEAGQHGPPEAGGVALVDGQEVGQARRAGVHLGAAEGLLLGVLPGGHLHQRRAAEEHLGLAPDHDRVVAHAGDVGAAGGGVAEHQRHRRDAGRRQPGQVPEQGAAGQEDLGLAGEVGAARFHEVDEWEPVAAGDLEGPEQLLEAVGVDGPAPHGGVVGGHDALHPGDDTDTGDHAGPDGVLGAPGGQRGELEEVGVAVDEQLDPLPGEQLPPGPVPLDHPGAAAAPGQGQLLVELGQPVEEEGPVGLVGLGPAVEAGGEDGHRRRSLRPAPERRAAGISRRGGRRRRGRR